MSTGRDSFGVTSDHDSKSSFTTCDEKRSAKSGSSRGSLRSQQRKFHLRNFSPGTSEVESMLDSSLGSVQYSSNQTVSIQFDSAQTDDVESDSFDGTVFRTGGLAAPNAVSTFSFSNRVKRSNFWLKNTYVYRKLPCSKKIWLVYCLFFLYGLAEFSTNILLFFLLHAYRRLNPPEKVASYLFMRFLIYTSYPVTGFLADTFFGRYKVILTSLFTALFGAVALAIAFSTSLDPWLDRHADYSFISQNPWPDKTAIVMCLLVIFLWVGFTGIRVNLIPFGVDQLLEASSGELSSYFHWYYWWMNAGYLVATVVLPYIYVNSALGYVFLLIAVCFGSSILVLVLYRDNGFIIQPHTGNPLKLVVSVIRSSLRAKRPQFRSAFDIGRPPPSRIDLTMNIHGGRFTVEQVEDVKTFFRILLILLTFFGYFAVASQLQTTYLLEAMRMTVPSGVTDELKCPSFGLLKPLNVSIMCQRWTVAPSLWLGLANIVPVLILIPICDRLVYPCIRFAMLKRMAAGKLFLFLSIVVAIAVEAVRHNQLASHLQNGTFLTLNAIPFHTGTTTRLHVASPMSILWIMPQYFLFAFAEVLANITAVEFIYAQSPAAMKGILLGLLFGTEGIAMGCSAFVIYLQGKAEKFNYFSFFGNSNHYVQDFLYRCLHGKHYRCEDGPQFAYILVGLFVFFSVIFFCVAAIRYKFRKRDMDPYNPNF